MEIPEGINNQPSPKEISPSGVGAKEINKDIEWLGEKGDKVTPEDIVGVLEKRRQSTYGALDFLKKEKQFLPSIVDIAIKSKNEKAFNEATTILSMLKKGVKKDSIITAFEKGIDMPSDVWDEIFKHFNSLKEFAPQEKEFAKYYYVLQYGMYTGDPIPLIKKMQGMVPFFKENMFKDKVMFVPEISSTIYKFRDMGIYADDALKILSHSDNSDEFNSWSKLTKRELQGIIYGKKPTAAGVVLPPITAPPVAVDKKTTGSEQVSEPDFIRTIKSKGLNTSYAEYTLTHNKQIVAPLEEIMAKDEKALDSVNNVIHMLDNGVKKDSIITAFEKGIDMPSDVWDEIFDSYHRQYFGIEDKELAKYHFVITYGMYTGDPMPLFKKALELTPDKHKELLIRAIINTPKLRQRTDMFRRAGKSDKEILDVLLTS